MAENEVRVIRELPRSMINKIAAGEVVERPASAVKELVENSIDAGATRIDVEVEKSGVEFIKVIDNGCGIPADQLELALSPHATSKLSRPEDLFRIATLGFRGEALASIAGISHLTLTSRAENAPDGALAHGLYEVLYDLVAYVGLEESEADLPHRVLYVGLGEAALPAEFFESKMR